MPSIFDIEQLRSLRPFSEGTGEQFVLHGGVAYRYALRLTGPWKSDARSIDLFDLTPFTADIDLLHSGKFARTPVVKRHVLRNVPNADCFRWEIRSEQSQNQYRRVLPHSAAIPARQISLSQDGFVDPLNGLADIQERAFRYVRNERFRWSPLYMEGRDLEYFSALLYMQTLFEADLGVSGAQRQPGRESVAEVFSDAGSRHDIGAAASSRYLTARTIYLLFNCLSAARDEEFWPVAERYHLDRFLAEIAISRLPLPGDLRVFFLRQRNLLPVLCPSSALSSHRFRLPITSGDWNDRYATRKDKEPFRFAKGQRVLGSSPIMKVEPGKAPSGTPEFIHFRIPRFSGSGSTMVNEFDETDLSLVMAIRHWPLVHLPRALGWRVIALPCVVQRLARRGRSCELLVRINTLGLFNPQAASRVGAQAQFFVVGLMNGEIG